jgi:ferredoxin-NADP reductase
VLARHERAPGVFEIEIDREGLEYRAGDCTLLIRSDRVDSRPYSFSSHPDEPVLRFLVRRLGTDPVSSFSTWLGGLVPGDEVGIGTPFGWFRPGSGPGEVWFATGTGVSPFLAALRSAAPLRPLAYCIGVRTAEDAVLKTWTEARAPVTWAFSRDAPPRRVTSLAAEVPIGPEIQYFLCGNQRMIRSVGEVLIGRGVLPQQIREELFFQ